MAPATSLPLTSNSFVQAQNLVITAHNNVGQATSARQVRGIVFPTGADGPQWAVVTILKFGTSTADIDFGPWLTSGLPQPLSGLDLLSCSTRVDRSSSGLRLRRSFHLLFNNQSGIDGGAWLHPANAAVNKLVPDSPRPWLGNVLAVQCANGVLGFDDFSDADLGLVIRSVKSILRSEEWGSDTDESSDSEEDSENEVPVHRGVARPTSVDDLDTEVWFDAGRGIASPTSDLTDRCFRISRFPADAAQDLKNPFTFVIAPQHSTGRNVHPVNETMRTFAPDVWPPLRGNVLAFCHSKARKGQLVDVEEKHWIAVTLMAARICPSAVSS
ncbi:hypothetical protein B0H15DRAFT_800339 [Mycena belliarum]|uniref:Uncharacterized protein n=1 Tax=Mycena belliarum TaxID=1033014 RepID=A0AAD6U5C6_9AGAR|nr:hypothetical protein B0H15DRAFT_803718 [Mycena belliae]KAJ7090427.1 hypothetical protein B0H15DRAFT_800339 [Mycena belliae]